MAQPGPEVRLFDRHALGQIARLIHVSSAQGGHVVGEQLKGDDCQYRRQKISQIRDIDDLVGLVGQSFVAYCRDSEGNPFGLIELDDQAS